MLDGSVNPVFLVTVLMLLAKPRLLSVAVGRRVFREGMAVMEHKALPAETGIGSPRPLFFEGTCRSQGRKAPVRPIAVGLGANL